MSRSIGNKLPAILFADLDGDRLEDKVGLTFLLVTFGDTGWPSIALLSAGEVVAPTDSTVRLGLWPGTTAASNLVASGHGTLAVFAPGRAHYVRLTVKPVARVGARGTPVAMFNGEVDDVLQDEVAYARLISGIMFELAEPAKVLVRWQSTVAELLARPTRADVRQAAADGAIRSPGVDEG